MHRRMCYTHELPRIAVMATICQLACTSTPASEDAAPRDLLRDQQAVDRPLAERRNTPDAFPSPTPDDCLTDVAAGQHTFTCENIRFDVSVPKTCISAPCGLIIDVHGACGNATVQDSHTNLRALGEKHNFIVVQPTAPGFTTCPYGIGKAPFWSTVPGADAANLAKIMQRVAAAWHVDPQRIHFTGFSQGGILTWIFICNYSHLLASVAPAATSHGCAPDANTKQIDILYLMGRQDTLYDSFVAMSAKRDSVIAAWGLGPVQSIAGDRNYTHNRYTNAEGTVLETIEHDYVTDPTSLLADAKGHCYPGSTAATGTVLDALKCQPPNGFIWGEQVIKFFMAHPKKK